MSFDVFVVPVYALFLAAEGLFLLASYRAVEILRGFVSRVYQRRALTLVFLGLVMAVVAEIPRLPSLPPTGPVATFENDFAVPFVFLLFFALFFFVDSSLKIVTERDFFHRQILGWHNGRWLVGGLLGAGIVGTLFISVTFFFLYVAGALVFFFYGGACLLVGSRRVADRVFKGQLKFFGLFLVFFVLQLPLTVLSNGFDVFILAAFVFGALSAYSLYRSVMSLSVVGKVEKVVSAESKAPLIDGEFRR